MNFRKAIEHLVLKYLVVPPAPKVSEGKKIIACVGDSITFGAGVQKNREVSTWEYYLDGLLGNSWQVLNYGISGRTLQDEGDYPYTTEKFFPLTHALQAEVYLIMLGTNDAKPYNWDADRYARELAQFADSYARLPNHPTVILMTPPACFADAKTGTVNFDIDPTQVDGPIYDTVRLIAAEKGMPCIDLHSFTAGHGEWFDDGVHPNYEGNRAIAQFLAPELQTILGI